jgi:hypothetical protein
MRTIDLESVSAGNFTSRGRIDGDGFETFLGLWNLAAGGSLSTPKGVPSRLDMSSNKHSP